MYRVPEKPSVDLPELDDEMLGRVIACMTCEEEDDKISCDICPLREPEKQQHEHACGYFVKYLIMSRLADSYDRGYEAGFAAGMECSK